MNLKSLYQQLGMNKDNGLHFLEENTWLNEISKRDSYIIKDKLKPSALFIFNNKPIILFYNKPNNKTELFKKIWNYGESPIIIISNYNSLEIYNGYKFLKKDKSLAFLAEDKEIDAFSYLDIVTGKTLDRFSESLNIQNKVDYYLLENIKTAKEILSSSKFNINSPLANAIIGKCILARYLIDREVYLSFKGQKKLWTNAQFCELLKNKNETINFFSYLQKQFNGEAFLIPDTELNHIPLEAFHLLSELFNGTRLDTGQQSLFDIYDFSIIPVEFISNVYEYFIGKDNQASKGAYYTPKFLVDFILTDSIDKYFAENINEYNCKVLDPACGSGIFLVEVLRKIIERFKELNPNLSKKEIKLSLSQLAEDNIYGIDKDESAINVALFSIYLTLLDYQQPKDIETFRFPELKANKNFICCDFFDLQARFNNKLKNIKFNYILGNPPWQRNGQKDKSHIQYLKLRTQKESNTLNKNLLKYTHSSEIAEGFLIRCSDFCSTHTKCALIVRSKILYNLNSQKFRRYFLENFYIDKILELASVRREVFNKSNDSAIAPGTIIFFNYANGNNTDSHMITHISLKPNSFFTFLKIILIQANDVKIILQKKLKDEDWLWKILVYGTYLDYNFIHRLKNNYNTISLLETQSLVKTGQGLKKNKGTFSTESIYNKPWIDTKDIHPFFIDRSKQKLFKRKKVDRIRNLRFYDKFKLLIAAGLNTKLQLKCAISYENEVFGDSLSVVKITNEDDIYLLKILNGLLASSLSSYFFIHTGVNIGIERPKIQTDEILNFPYIINNEIEEIVDKIETTIKNNNLYVDDIFNSFLPDNLRDMLISLDEAISRAYNLSATERALIDYTQQFTTPMIINIPGYKNSINSRIMYKDDYLQKYLTIFINKFSDIFYHMGKRLAIDIMHSDYVIGIFFKIQESTNNLKNSINWENKEYSGILSKMLSLGLTKESKNLFIQKDIRGFENEGFYIVKPNEKRLWHEAIGYLDVNEFHEAILIAGRDYIKYV